MTSVGTAGAAAFALSGSRSVTAAGKLSDAHPDPASVDGVVIHISNAARGEATIMGHGTELVVVDRALVAAVARASRTGNRGA